VSKTILENNPSVQEMLNINRFSTLGFLEMGDAAGPFESTWSQMGLSNSAGKPGI